MQNATTHLRVLLVSFLTGLLFLSYGQARSSDGSDVLEPLVSQVKTSEAELTKFFKESLPERQPAGIEKYKAMCQAFDQVQQMLLSQLDGKPANAQDYDRCLSEFYDKRSDFHKYVQDCIGTKTAITAVESRERFYAKMKQLRQSVSGQRAMASLRLLLVATHLVPWTQVKQKVDAM